MFYFVKTTKLGSDWYRLSKVDNHFKNDQIGFLYRQTFVILKNGPTLASFHLYRSSSNKHNYNFTKNINEKMSIQYTVLGFEPTTFGT